MPLNDDLAELRLYVEMRLSKAESYVSESERGQNRRNGWEKWHRHNLPKREMARDKWLRIRNGIDALLRSQSAEKSFCPKCTSKSASDKASTGNRGE